MKKDSFDFLAKLVQQRSGIALTEDKAYLVDSRLMPVARKLNFADIDALALAARLTPTESLLLQITDAMTTNESFFFRDQHPFDQFRKILLPYLLQKRAATKKIRLWSAAASSGQEAYSLAIICHEEAAKLQGWTVDIIGTDLSSEIIAKARQGIYNQFEVQRGLPIAMQLKYFTKLDANQWQIKDDLRKMVQFREGNLIKPFGPVGIFDIIFCRNVLIYFDAPTKTKVFAALHSVTAADGALLLGGAETTVGLTDQYRPVKDHRGLFARDQSPEPFKLSA